MSKVQIFNTVGELEEFEYVDSKVSAKYVAIYSSQIIKDLAPEWSFVEGTRFWKRNTAHSVLLENKEGDRISITNSYDRSAAFSLHYLVKGGIRIPLNLDRQVHIGKNAASLVEDLTLNKDELAIAVKQAKTLVLKMKDTRINDRFKPEIIDIVFSNIVERKDFLELDLTIGDEYTTVYSYITTVVERFFAGHYNYVVKLKSGEEKIRKGKVNTNRFSKLYRTNKLYQHLLEKHLELFM